MPLPIMFEGDKKLGDVNQYVMLLQRFLALNGLLGRRVPTDPDPVNGMFDSVTEAAVRRFQAIRHIPVSGVVKGQTWAAIAGVSQDLKVVDSIELPLELPAVRLGDQNTLITVMQRLLVEYSGRHPGQEYIPEGIITPADVENGQDTFDEVTQRAVEAFQVNRGIQIDGEVGSETWETLLFPKGRS